MAKLLRVGIIGAGSVARTIHWPGFSRLPGVSVTAVCDPDRPAGDALAASAGLASAERDAGRL
ncbi:MAG: hypothetical protein ACRD96_21195, partial [Bryobacteraceae bacterium]